MSPALQKLRKDLDLAKSRSKQPGSVGFDVVDLLFSAFVAQDAEIRKLKGEKVSIDGAASANVAGNADAFRTPTNADAYIGHVDVPLTSPVYTGRNIRPVRL